MCLSNICIQLREMEMRLLTSCSLPPELWSWQPTTSLNCSSRRLEHTSDPSWFTVHQFIYSVFRAGLKPVSSHTQISRTTFSEEHIHLTLRSPCARCAKAMSGELKKTTRAMTLMMVNIINRQEKSYTSTCIHWPRPASLFAWSMSRLSTSGLYTVSSYSAITRITSSFAFRMSAAIPNSLKGTLQRRIAYIFLVHLESIYYQIFFYSKIVPNCAVAK